jgi:hypothetical protein
MLSTTKTKILLLILTVLINIQTVRSTFGIDLDNSILISGTSNDVLFIDYLENKDLIMVFHNGTIKIIDSSYATISTQAGLFGATKYLFDSYYKNSKITIT